MTYAPIASKIATLMAIMIKKNFPIALSPQTQRDAAGIVLRGQPYAPLVRKRARQRGEPLESKSGRDRDQIATP
jgi:hypothetical protein